MSACMYVYVKTLRLVSRIFLDHFSTFFFLRLGLSDPKLTNTASLASQFFLPRLGLQASSYTHLAQLCGS